MPRLNRQRSRFGLLAAACIFVAVGVGVVLGAQRLIADAGGVAHTHQVIGAIEEMEARLRDAESAQRGYLLTANPLYLADYRNATARLPGIHSRLHVLVRDSPGQATRAQRLWSQVQVRLRQLGHTLERYREGGLPAAQAVIGQDVIDVSTAIRGQAASMVAAENVLLATRSASTRDSANLLRALALLGIPIGLFAIFAVYRLLAQEIRRRAAAENNLADANEQLRVGLDHVERGSVDLRALSRYGSMLQSCMTPPEALQLTEKILAGLLPGASGRLYRIRNSQDHAELAAQWGTRAPSDATMIPVDDCWALRRGQPYAALDPGAPRCAHIGSDADARIVTLCLPLAAQGAQLGLLSLAGPEGMVGSHRDIVEAVAEKLSMALATLSLQDRLRQQSIRDPLTGLFNRRYLEESAAREVARCARRDLPLSLLMLDIDHFKAFNDLQGHPGGDALLGQFGKLLASMTRGEDIACRFGGEEFTLIMPEIGPEDARQRAETIRIAVQALQVPYLGKLLPQVTVSIGIASFPSHGTTPEALLQVADAALYRAKRAGRNCVELDANATPGDQPG